MSEEKLHEAIVNFANALEAACVDLKRYIGGIHGVAPEIKHGSKDFDSLKWTTKESAKGPYRQTTKEANENNEVFQSLQAVLKKNNGFAVLSGTKFWFHQNNNDIIDRRGKKTSSKPISTEEAQVNKGSVDNVRMLFSKDLEDLLLFEEKEEYVVIRPRQYLGSENFAKIASVIRDEGGEYVSAGKDSHFRVPKRK